MIIKMFIEPPIDNNNYLIIDEQSKEAALVDCSSVNEEVRNTLAEYEASLKYILLTHGHFDHVAGIRNNPDVKAYMHEGDMGLLQKVNNYLPLFGMPEITIPRVDVFIKDGDVIKLGEMKIKVIHTPGHTQGGVCYLVDGKLFSGDTIFRESVGRCDLEGGNFEQIVESIENKIFTLPDDIEIYPGHGRSTTVSWERLNNQFL